MKHTRNIYINIAAIFMVAMFFSCTNNAKEVRNFLAEKNLPIAVAKNAYHVYKDSGRITSKLTTPLLHDFSNRKDHPYNEFPKGIKIVTIDKNGIDSTTVTGNYALSYSKTSISEIRGNVVVVNHTGKSKLVTDQLYWDQKLGYFFSEDKFILIQEKDTFTGVGFESKEDLTKWMAKDVIGNLEAKQN
ncbi:LPS export ABC transporter periplasmic protein LptC [Tenacibaculum aquimarinum]|uniref:LPS export ABC transporter periplasmic protein LptC n=1 Tax=Tenacibaculum aquimarinum TaxID=2910675 RepID=UPI001F0A1BE9|nr:LPS export ABC transporter periplasmic protein LptC [Tenacibaculum aquimarinum]MCH3884409.1 LPS export ABC transporter periplasmic protein LptC [Tenacibaculum aquimarinum]